MIIPNIIIHIATLLLFKPSILKCDFIDQYIRSYEDRVRYFFESNMTTKIHQFNITIANISMFLQTYTLTQSQAAFSFDNSNYVLSFNMLIQHENGQLITIDNCIMEHKLEYIKFKAKADKTFEVEFKDNPYECSFDFGNLPDFKLFEPIVTSQVNICGALVFRIKNKIHIFIKRFPQNEEAHNFEDLFFRLMVEENSRDNRTHICDHKLNETHRIINVKFNLCSYVSQLALNEKSAFRYVTCDIDYTIMHEPLIVNHLNKVVKYKDVEFSQKEIKINMFGDDIDELTYLISAIMFNFEKHRKWIHNY